eukprot:1000384-Rhodomonas_salina.1
MELHVDAFADEHNKRCERFWAQHPVFGSEVTDAFDATSWGPTWCSECSCQHDQGLWVFPPIPLLAKTVLRLKQDCAHGVLLTPVRRDAAWWPALVRACGSHGFNYLDWFSPLSLHGDTPEHRQRHDMYTHTRWALC